MPDMPAITVTTSQLTRLIAAFPGANNAEKADAYRAWVKALLRDYVIRAETRTMDQNHEATRRAAIDAAIASLP